MEYILIGKIVSTHGIKGEIKILSNFLEKELVFKKDIPVYIGKEKEAYIIESYRHHKIYEMITLQGLNNINDVLRFKNSFIYIKRANLNLNSKQYLIEDLIGYSVVEEKEILGKVENISYNNGNNLLKVTGIKDFYIPLAGNFIKEVNIQEQIITIEHSKELIL